MSYLERLRELNNHVPRRYLPLSLAGERFGWVTPVFARALAPWREVFQVSDGGVRLAKSLEGCDLEARSRRVHAVVEALRDAGTIEGWRDEIHKVARRWEDPPVLFVERAAIPYFGVGGFAVHMNGFVRRHGRLWLWVARRADDKPVEPGKLDHLVAGGQPAHLGLRDNLVKECAEEAGIPADLARQAVPTGCVSYTHDSPRGCRPDTVYTFDLDLPADFRPVNADGEVASFSLWPIEKVAARVRDSRDFKSNSALVIIDFLLRHGVISETDPDYEAIRQGLRRPAP